MVTPHTYCSVCVIFEKLSVHLWMLRIELDFTIFFFFSDEAFNKKNVGKNIKVSRFFVNLAPELIVFLLFSLHNGNIYYAVRILWETHTHHVFWTLLSIWLNCRGKQKAALLLWSRLMAPAAGWPCPSHPLIITALANGANTSQWDFPPSPLTHIWLGVKWS